MQPAFKRPSPRPSNDGRAGRGRRGGRDQRGGPDQSGGPDRRRWPALPPDHRRNPQNWTKYSLEDVSTDQLSDRSNTAAALDFLKQLKRRKTVKKVEENEKMAVDEEEEGPPADLSQPITFRKPLLTKNSRPKQSAVLKTPSDLLSNDNLESDEEPVVGKPSLVLPETVVEEVSGEPPAVCFKKVKKTADSAAPLSSKSKAASAIKLSHLDDEED